MTLTAEPRTDVDTHCPYCALQCGMSLTGTKVTPRRFPANGSGLCQKGWSAGALLSYLLGKFARVALGIWQ